MEKNEKISALKNEIINALSNAKTTKEVLEIRSTYFGKKGSVQELSNLMGSLPKEGRKEFGLLLNNFKNEVNVLIEEKLGVFEISELESKLENDKIDITLPGTKIQIGSTHPLTKIVEIVEDLFISMGYDVVAGPEVEYDLYNFEMLNIPPNHPARDTQDSFYITGEVLLRTQTSNVQARTMLSNADKSPIRIICPGKTFRKDDDDATHSHQFMQIEGLIIDKSISLANLKGTLEELVKRMFGSDRIVRFRPSYFPFTEPSYEVDVSCFKCGGEGCSICKHTGFIEVLGSGIVHPNVLKMGGYDPEIYTGFAFGMGVERFAMLKYGITDVRDFYTNDLRLLGEFNRVGGDE